MNITILQCEPDAIFKSTLFVHEYIIATLVSKSKLSNYTNSKLTVRHSSNF